MATTADIRNGLCINHNGEPWKIESFQHVKPGKGPAFVRTKIRNLNTGRLLDDEGMPLSATLPSHVELEIAHTEPGIKGNTATNTFKPATTETGASINVPLFINEGDKIKIDTEKGSYIERVKQ